MRLGAPTVGLQRALVELPSTLHRSLKVFRRATGISAVTSLATIVPDADGPLVLSPPVHPRCARRLRSVAVAPCAEQWRIHTRSLRRSPPTDMHTCPIGLRCSCVPIHFEDRLVGVAKLVVDPAKSELDIRTASSLLKLIVSQACQTLAVRALSDEVRLLRECVDKPLRLEPGERSGSKGSVAASARPSALVERTLAHLQARYGDPELSLKSIAGALRCNPKYVTSRFTEVTGEHMHIYLVRLRVSHACRLLLTTEESVKSIAHATGFGGAGRMAGAFRRHVGVSPREYRRIFSSP